MGTSRFALRDPKVKSNSEEKTRKENKIDYKYLYEIEYEDGVRGTIASDANSAIETLKKVPRNDNIVSIRSMGVVVII
jgi:hypothetical protein